MIMQVLSQGPSLLLAVWTGLALLEGGESYCRYSCASTESRNVRQGDSSVFSCEGTSISWCYTSRTPTQTITTSSNNQGIRNSWLVYSSITSDLTLQCDSSSSCIKNISVNVIVPIQSVSVSGVGNIGVGSTLHLTCQVPSGTRDTYQWYHNGTLLANSTSSYAKSAQLNDSGYYQCEACNWAGCSPRSSSYTVRVTVPPYSVSISGSSYIEYTQTLSLTCSASGIVESYRWYRNASYISTSTTNSYVISSAQLSDSGRYYCRACNWAGCTSSSSRTVRVTAPYPAISNLTSNPGSKVVVGRVGQLNLTCTARGTREAVQFTWRLNSTSYIPQSVNSESYFTSTLTRSTLTISPVTTQHNGNYSCTSTNTATGETDSSTLYIQVIDPPVATAVVTPQVHSCSGRRSGSIYSALSGTSHRFDCQSAGSPPLSSHWNISTLYTNVNRTATFPTMLSHNDEGMYVCTVRNTAESDLEDTEEVTVKVYDPPVLNISESVILKEGVRLVLWCSFTKHMNDPNSFPSITWTDPSGRTLGGSKTPQGLTLTSTYTRSSARRTDSGVYTCSVNNNCPAVGGLTDTINVTIYYVPDVVDVSSIEVTNTTFDTISIQWTPPNNNFDSIIDYRVVLYGSGGLVGVFNSSQPMVTLVSLQPFTTYQITISARNNAGWGGNSSGRNVNTLTRDEVLASSLTYSTPRVGVSSYTVELRWVVLKGLLTDKLEGYRLSRWPTNTTNIETTTVNRDNVSCAWNVTAIGSETYCHEWEGFSPESQYTVSLEIIYNYGILSTGGTTIVTITIPTLPPSQDEFESIGLAVGVAVGVLLAVLVTAAVLIVVLLICKKCRHREAKDTDTNKAYYNDEEDIYVIDDPQKEIDLSSFTDDQGVLNDPHYQRMLNDPHYQSLDLKTVQKSPYTPLDVGKSTIARENSGKNNDEYDFPGVVVPNQKKSEKVYEDIYVEADITQNFTTSEKNHNYANLMGDRQPGESERSPTSALANKTPYPGNGRKEVEEVVEEASRDTSEVAVKKKQNSHNANDNVPSKKMEKMDKVLHSPKQHSGTAKKQPLLPPTQQSATMKQQLTPTQQSATTKQQLTPTQQSATAKQQLAPTQQLATTKQQQAPTKQSATKKQQLAPIQQSATTKQQLAPTQQSATTKQQQAPTQQSATTKQQLAPTQQSATIKQQPLLPHAQQTKKPNPVMTGSTPDTSSKPSIVPKPKKQPLLPKQSGVAKQPPTGKKISNEAPPGSSVAQLRKKLEKNLQ